MRPNQVAAIKAMIRGLSIAAAEERLSRAVDCDDAAAARAVFSAKS